MSAPRAASHSPPAPSSASSSLAVASVSTSGFTEYRALTQVLAYASQHQHRAVEVVNNALIGGVASVFYDTRKRWSCSVILPSSKCVATLAPLLAEGYFCPSHSLSVENRTPRFSAISESSWCDLFRIVVLLFPDCFVDGPLLNMTRDQVADTPNVSALASSAPSRGSRSPTRHSSSLKDAQNTTPPPLSQVVMVLQVPPSDGATPTIVTAGQYSAAVEVELLGLHAARMRVAVAYLSSLNDSLHDVQVRMLREVKEVAPSASEASTAAEQGASGGGRVGGSRAELSTLRAVARYLLKAKMMLMCCMYATERVYTDSPSDANESIDTVTEESGSSLRPRRALVSLTGDYFSDPVETWLWDGDIEEWYDRMLARLCEAYTELPHRPPRTTFEKRLSLLKEEALADGRRLTHAPHLVLYSSSDKYPTIALAPSPAPSSRLPLPRLPLQPGELSMLLARRDATEVLLDATPSPFPSFLTLATARKLTSEEMQAETARLQARAWLDLPPISKDIVALSLTMTDPTVARLLEKNPVMLARLVMWGRYGTPSPARSTAASPGARTDCPFAAAVEEYVLFVTPFSVEVGQYLRETLTHTALLQSVFEDWLTHCSAVMFGGEIATAAVASPHVRTVAAIVDFAQAHCQWKLSPAVQERFSTSRRQGVF